MAEIPRDKYIVIQCQAGYPVSYKKPQGSGHSDFKASANPELLVELDELRENYSNENWQILDVRTDDEYSGKAAHGNKRVGHVPGALFICNGTGL